MMKGRWLIGGLVVAIVGLSLGLAAPAAAVDCPADSVPSGNICIDKYEASVWETTNARLIRQIMRGTVALADLTGAGAIQHGVASADYGPGCPNTGNGCVHFYAVSIPGVPPSAYLTWFQAAAAARNSGKRLPTNAEWQVAALGTPDTGGADNGATTCNTDALVPSGVTATGSRSACLSDVGAFDMVGNLREWVADWTAVTTYCPGWGAFSDDEMCLAGATVFGDPVPGPGALIRGGDFGLVQSAGVFAVERAFPQSAGGGLGFRAAR